MRQSSPFQCRACSYYCNWHSDLVDHVKQEHSEQEESFICQLCGFTSCSQAALLVHLSSYSHKELVSVVNRCVPVVIARLQLMYCEKCGESFKYNFTLRRHMKQAHDDVDFQLPDQPKYCCQFCSYFSFKKSSLKTHQFLVHPNTRLNYSCGVCKLQFTTKEGALRHRSTAQHRIRSKGHDQEARSCKHCNQQFTGEQEEHDHLVLDHLLQLPQCHRCGQLLLRPQLLPQHLKQGCPPSSLGPCADGPLACDLCNFTTHRESILTLHMSHVHTQEALQNEKGEEVCPVCSKVMPRKRLKAHLKTHNINKFSCQFCDKNFEVEEILKDHILSTHSNMKLHRCQECSYQNTKKSLLNLHIKRQHQDASQTKDDLICPACNSEFKQKNTFNKHIKSHQSENEGTPYQCIHPDCNFKALFKSDLDRHILKHMDTKSFVCSDCDFQCKRKSDLMRHNRLIHEDLPYLRCYLCDYKTKNKTHMKRHSKVHQELSTFEIQLDENDLVISESKEFTQRI